MLGIVERLGARVRMRFDDERLEARFRQHEFSERRGFQLFALRCGLLFYALLGLLDLQLGGPAIATLLGIRFFVALPFMVLLTRNFARAKRHSDAYLSMSLYLLIAGFSLVAMIIASTGMVQFTYPVGVMVVICFGAGFCGHDFRHSLAVSSILIFATIGALTVTNAPVWVYWSANVFLLSALAIMAVSSYTNERLSRDRFLTICDLEQSRIRAMALCDEAQRSSHAHNQFLAVVSHELRTPLNAVVGFSEMMHAGMHGPLTPPRYGEYARHIHESGHHLAGLIEDIIDISRADLGKLGLSEQTFDPRPVVEEAMAMCRGSAHTRAQRITLTTDESAERPVVRGDPVRWRQAIVNLVGNAVKFTPDGGRIDIHAFRTSSGGFAVTVSDNGPGIAADDIERIRKPFARVADSYSDDSPGLGLGLSIVERIAQGHGGTLIIESAPGEGSSFTLEMPSARVEWVAEGFSMAS